jgi:hypothetical protein
VFATLCYNIDKTKILANQSELEDPSHVVNARALTAFYRIGSYGLHRFKFRAVKCHIRTSTLINISRRKVMLDMLGHGDRRRSSRYLLFRSSPTLCALGNPLSSDKASADMCLRVRRYAHEPYDDSLLNNHLVAESVKCNTTS